MDGHRHDDLAHKPLRGILAWRRGYLSGLWPVFGTATHPTGTSEAFPRGETVISPTSLRLVIFTEQANMPYTHLERLSACSVFCSRGHTATDTGVRHQVPSHNWSPSGIRLIFGRSSARRPYLQMPQWHPRVAKRASIGTLARGLSTEALLGQGRVPKGRESVPLTGLWSVLRPGSAR